MTVAELRKLIAAALSPEGAVDVSSWRIDGPRFITNNSRIFHGEGLPFPAPVAIKVCVSPATGAPDATAARDQFAALHKVSEVFKEGSEFTVPRPLALIDDSGILITEWVAGNALDEILQDRDYPLSAITEFMARAGRWLRVFHDSRTLPEKPLHTGRLLDSLSDTLAGINLKSRRARVVRAAVDLLEETAPAVGRIPLPASWLHGDFKPHNVIIAGARTVGVDVHAVYENAVVSDLAHFLNHIHFISYHPGGIRASSTKARLETAFLEAYSNGTHVEPGPLYWMQIHGIVRAWAEVMRRSAWQPRNWYLARCMTRTTGLLAGRLGDRTT